MSGPQEASGRARSGWRGWVDRLFAPVDIASLVYFRIVFGAVMLWEVTRYFQHDWIRRYWIEPAFNFTYYGFEWAKPLPGDAMYGLWFALGLCALAIMVGFAYRAATVLFFLGFTYSFLLEQARYLNHFYLVSLIAFLMIWLPAHRRWSLDARANPKLRTDTVPAWTLGILQFQIAIVYFFGGVAKLNPDWLQARPIGRWLAARGDLPLVGPWLETVAAGYFFAYSGLLFDLLIVPALLWKRTRVLAFFAAVGFHLTNAVIFEIGIFPWFGLAATALFFPPDWPRRFVGWAGGLVGRIPATPSVGANGRGRFSPMYRRAILAFVLAWGVVQVGLPLRHWMYPGSPSWTEEGHNWAWHMKLRSKKATATFYGTGYPVRPDRDHRSDPLPDPVASAENVEPARHDRRVCTPSCAKGRRKRLARAGRLRPRRGLAERPSVPSPHRPDREPGNRRPKLETSRLDQTIGCAWFVVRRCVVRGRMLGDPAQIFRADTHHVFTYNERRIF
ncbi:MAG: HTTM domain-containing protein [Bacteroidota bacterium]